MSYTRCKTCHGEGLVFGAKCTKCKGGWKGVKPRQPCEHRPGSEEKQIVLAARYATGVPLWNDRDCKHVKETAPIINGGAALDQDDGLFGEGDDYGD